MPFTDFAAAAVSNLAMARDWNSNDTSFFGGPVGAFGRGWHHGWEATLACDGDRCTVGRGAQSALIPPPGNTAVPATPALTPPVPPR